MSALSEGREALRRGDHAEVERLGRSLVGLEPDNAEAWHLLGLSRARLQQFAEAEALFREAIRARPTFAAAHSDLGIALVHQNRLTEALPCFQAAVSLDPASADSLNNLGSVSARLGRFEEAATHLRQSLLLNAGNLSALSNLVQVLTQLGKVPELIEFLRHLVHLHPTVLTPRLVFGGVLLQERKAEEALTNFEAAARLAPESLDAIRGLGIALSCLKRYAEAEGYFRQVLQVEPNSADVHNFVGDCLRYQQRTEEALAAYERSIQCNPNRAEAHHNRGFALDELRRLEETVASFDEAVRLKPDYSEAYHNRGVSLVKLSRYTEALADFDRAIQLQPDFAEAWRNRALLLLTLGNLKEGWSAFEWHWWLRDRSVPRHSQPLWEGEPLEGRTILIHVEQGLGDTIQFARYAALVKARGGRVVVESQKPLVPLLQTCPGIDLVVPKGSPLPPFELHDPLMRLMGVFTPDLESIPASIPYLYAEPERVDRWRNKLGPRSGLRVGLAWQGNPLHSRDLDRSFTLKEVEPLLRAPGVQFVSLQRGRGVEQLAPMLERFPIVDLGDEVDPGLEAMQDTPAIMMNLDLIVAPDTALAHLAGALGLPVWVALPKAPDWRWLLDRDDSPWYPTARLFRQTERGRWGPVFERMAEALKRMMNEE